MATERFEMRIDSELLDRLDQWRSSEDDSPSRAEAVRRLLENGLAHDSRGRAPRLSDGEKLIAMMLAELIEKTGLPVETDVAHVQKAIVGGHYWSLAMEMPGIFHGHTDKQTRVRFVTDVLDMWTFIEEAHEKLSDDERADLEKAGFTHVTFPGFDGNNEGEYLSIARHWTDDLSRFGRFDGRSLNSHHPVVEGYAEMYAVFEPIRAKLIGRCMSLSELQTVLAARRS
jgi:uncharacterized protein YfbU (UPF0304 family)